MRLVQLEYFIKVAECSSITRAAKELYISQPSLTKSIANLEAEYGIKLLERVPKGVSLTPKGREFLGYARDVVNSRRVLEETFGKKAERMPIQRFHVSSQQLDFIYDLLGQIYHENGATTCMHIEEIDRGSIIEGVANGKTDIGILVLTRDDSRYFEMSLKKQSLEVHELDTSGVYVCMSRKSPLFKKEIVTTSDASQYLHVVLDMDEPTRREQYQESVKKEKAVNRDQLIFCNTIGACLHFLRHTGALLYVPKWVLGSLEAEPDIRVVPLHMNDGTLWPQINHLCWIKREGEELSIIESRFAQLLTHMFSS